MREGQGIGRGDDLGALRIQPYSDHLPAQDPSLSSAPLSILSPPETTEGEFWKVSTAVSPLTM